MKYAVQIGSSSVVIKTDTIMFEDGFVKFFCAGSKNLVAAYPVALVSSIQQVQE